MTVHDQVNAAKSHVNVFQLSLVIRSIELSVGVQRFVGLHIGLLDIRIHRPLHTSLFDTLHALIAH